MEMYAAEECRAGVLEPEGIVDIKFRKRDLLKAIDRIIPSHYHQSKASIKQSKEQLLPIFRQAAIKFAALHDTPQVVENIFFKMSSLLRLPGFSEISWRSLLMRLSKHRSFSLSLDSCRAGHAGKGSHQEDRTVETGQNFLWKTTA